MTAGIQKFNILFSVSLPLVGNLSDIMAAMTEFCGESRSTIIREKQIKNMSRQNKIELVKHGNPLMRDLYEDFSGRIPDRSSTKARTRAGMTASRIYPQESHKNQQCRFF